MLIDRMLSVDHRIQVRNEHGCVSDQAFRRRQVVRQGKTPAIELAFCS
jgi:hypothetical protein